MFCPNCGKEISDSTKFCTYCGYQIASSEVVTVNLNDATKNQAKNKKMIFAILSILLCVAIVMVVVIATQKSPKELLVENKWYYDFEVDCEYIDFTYGDTRPGYWFSAVCKQEVFFSYGETENTVYLIGGYGSSYGPFSYEITADNIPSNIEWRKEVKDYSDDWEILNENVLKYNTSYYIWDDAKEANCNCKNKSNCNHRKTWCVTKNYLRIGVHTYSSHKPAALRISN